MKHGKTFRWRTQGTKSGPQKLSALRRGRSWGPESQQGSSSLQGRGSRLSHLWEQGCWLRTRSNSLQRNLRRGSQVPGGRSIFLGRRLGTRQLQLWACRSLRGTKEGPQSPTDSSDHVGSGHSEQCLHSRPLSRGRDYLSRAHRQTQLRKDQPRDRTQAAHNIVQGSTEYRQSH